MRAQILRYFETADPVIANIVSLTKQYELTPAQIRKQGERTAFEVLAGSIASQQLSGVVARRITQRLVDHYDGHFPTPAQLAAATPEALRAIGFSFAKVAALHDLARHSLDGRLPEETDLAALDDETLIERFTAVHGIGRWTVQMMLMFHLGRQDVLPVDDFGVRNGFRLAYGLSGMPQPRALAIFGERWRPWRSAAAWHLWRAVELHQAGTLPERVGRKPRVALAKPAPRAARKAQ